MCDHSSKALQEPHLRANRLLDHLAKHLEEHSLEIGQLELDGFQGNHSAKPKLEVAQAKMNEAAILLREAAELLLQPQEIH